MPPKAYKNVDAFLADLPAETLAVVQELRTLIRAAHPGLVEGIKWNAPSFALDGTDLVTLGLQRDGTTRLVLHRGAKAKDNSGFRFDDPAGLADWPAPDRGVVVIKDSEEMAAKSEQLTAMVGRWVGEAGDATAPR